MGIFTPDEQCYTADQDACPDRDDDQIQRRGLLRGLIAKRSKVIPTAVAAAMARIAAGISGIFMKGEEEKGQHPAEHHKLPLGKVMIPVSVVDDGEAKTDQSVDGTIREAG